MIWNNTVGEKFIEIGGVPQQQDEDAENIAFDISKVLGIEINRKEIQGCHRISLKPNSPIICKLTNKKIKEVFIKKRRELARVESLSSPGG